MPLIHVCSDQQRQIWKLLGVHAQLSGVALRDYLTYLILTSRPVGPDNPKAVALLRHIVDSNKAARSGRPEPAPSNSEKSRSAFVVENEGGKEVESDTLSTIVENSCECNLQAGNTRAMETAAQMMSRYVTGLGAGAVNPSIL